MDSTNYVYKLIFMNSQYRFPMIPQVFPSQGLPIFSQYKCTYTYYGIDMPDYLIPESEKAIAYHNKLQTYDIKKIQSIDVGVIYRILKSKKVKSQGKYAMIKILSSIDQKFIKVRLVKILDIGKDLINLSNPKALIGKKLLISGDKIKFFSIIELLDGINQVEKIPKKGLQRITFGTIKGYDYHSIYCIDSKGRNHMMNIAVFFSYNKIDMQMDPSIFMDETVNVLSFNNQEIFEMIKTVLKLDSNNPVSYLPNNDMSIYHKMPPEYDFSRIPVTSTRISEKLNPTYADYYVSPPKLSGSISNVVSLFIFEHYIRFDRDIHFKDCISKIMESDKKKQAGFKEFSTSVLAPSEKKNMSTLHSSLAKYTTMQDVGRFFVQNTKNDIETLAGLKELSDKMSVAIELYDFTDAFYQVKIVPEIQTEKIPIMHLGKCSGCFFLMYSKSAMHADGFLVEPGAKTVMDIKTISDMTFYYHINNSYYGSQLFKLIASLNTKLNGIKASITAKAKGAALPVNNFGFEEEAFMIRDLAQDIGQIKLIDEANKFARSSFEDSLLVIAPAKFICMCNCKTLFLESFKVSYPCGCMFFHEHNDYFIKQGGYRCACGKSQLNLSNYNPPTTMNYYHL